MGEIRAKLVRKITSDSAWWFDKYELECIKCSEHYFNGRYDNRTVPYCSKCKRDIDKQRTKLLKEEKAKRLENSIWNKAVDEAANTIKGLYSFTIDEEKMIDEAIKDIKR